MISRNETLPLEPKPATGHDSELLPRSYHPHRPSPDLTIISHLLLDLLVPLAPQVCLTLRMALKPKLVTSRDAVPGLITVRGFRIIFAILNAQL